MLFIPLFFKTESINHVCRLVSALAVPRFAFLHCGSGSAKTRPKAGAVAAAVQAKENNVAQTNAVAANAAPPMSLG